MDWRETMQRMLVRMEEAGQWPAVCEEARAVLEAENEPSRDRGGQTYAGIARNVHPEWPVLYDVILTDPPWSYYGQQDKMGAAGKEYRTMSDADILAYRYPLSKRGVLFMWATGPRLNLALDCLDANGLHFRGVAFVWVKTRADGTPLGATGVRPSIVKPITEFVLAASYVSKGRPLPLHDEAVVQTVFAPRGRHSEKPEAVHKRIEMLYPCATKAEFFARRHVSGWDCFGDELPNYN